MNWKGNNMKIMAAFIALTSFALMIWHWDTPLAIAWGVAFTGWFPQIWSNNKQETADGHQT
jgi:hypothetical protein